MSSTAAKIAALRASLAKIELENPETHVRVPLGYDKVDACLLGGLRRGALHEIFAEGGHEASATGFAAALSFRMAADKRVLWIRQDFSAIEFGDLAATGLVELGLDPARLLLLRLADAADVLRAASDALSCAALGAVVIEIRGDPKILDMVASRRLTLASAQKGVTAFLLRFNAKPQVGTAETRWRIRAARSPDKEENWGSPVFEAELVRNRYGHTGRWVMEWRCDDGLFQKPCDKGAADSGAVVSAPCDRSIAAAMEGIEGAKAVRRIA
jgi:protein ImuA